MNEKYTNLIISLCIAIAMQMAFMLLTMASPEGSFMHRIWIMLGGTFPDGIIQGISYFLFFYGLFEIRRISRNVRKETKAFEMGLLPETEQFVLLPDDVAKLKLTMIDIDRKEKFMLVDLIKKACTKYRSSHSISETMELISKQAGINQRNAESEQSIIRYIAWAIPSVGFIGTVVGIAASLGAAKDAVSSAGIKKITDLMNIAFDTTLVALVLSLILMFFYHQIQEQVEKIHANMESYVLENLINRLYTA